MHKWVVEQWRDGEKILTVEFTDDMIQRQGDNTLVITFPPAKLAGGLVLATNDELRLSETQNAVP